MVHVIAGTAQEFRDYLWENKLSGREARYVSGVDSLRGIWLGVGDRIVKYGTFYRRDDLPQIEILAATLEGR